MKKKLNLKQILAISVIFIILVMSVISVYLFINRTLVNNNKAAVISSVNITSDSSTAAFNPNQTKKVTYNIKPMAVTDGISGFDLTLKTTGVLQITNIDNIISSPNGTPVQVIKQIQSTSSRVVYIYNQSDNLLPNSITFDVTTTATTAGTGKLSITSTSSQVSGKVLNNLFQIASVQDITFTIGTPLTTVAPTNTSIPFTPSPRPTSTLSPTIAPTNSACLCSNDACSNSCSFTKDPSASYPAAISCKKEVDDGAAADKNSYCNRPMRLMGDADGDGKINSIDYIYYVRAVNGGIIPPSINPDFNGDGFVSPSDRAIVVRNVAR